MKYQSDNYFLGYLGERAVAEELGKLGHPQWRVFHDLQINPKRGNIDHIVVGAKGIFCLETKAWRHSPEQRRKILLDNGAVHIKGRRRNYEVVNQAKGNAAELHAFLRRELQTSIPFIVPVIVFPGWSVDEQNGEMAVYGSNGKRIGTMYARNSERLCNLLDGAMENNEPTPENLIKDICAALEKHNRISIEDIP